MFQIMQKYWWLVLLRGIAAVVFITSKPVDAFLRGEEASASGAAVERRIVEGARVEA